MTPTQAELCFDGATYEHQFDAERLGDQARAVWNVVKDGRWRTLSEIGDSAGVRSEASISARLRDFRKDRFGAHTVNRQQRGDPSDGLFEYSVIVNGGRL